MRRRAARLTWIVCLVGLIVVVVGLLGADRAFYEQVSRRLNTEDHPTDRDFYAVTKPFWIACRCAFAHVCGIAIIYFLLLGLHPKGWRTANSVLASVIAAGLLANLAQHAIGRDRPNRADRPAVAARSFWEGHLSGPASFPSGEAATAFALACVLSRVLPRYRWTFYAVSTLTAVARLVNGAHYISDVAAGAVLGVLCAGSVFDCVDRSHDRVVDLLRRRLHRRPSESR